MDESWDAEFDGELRVPDSVRSVSDNIRSETNAARCLSKVVSHIREELMQQHPQHTDDTLVRGVALVHGSINSEDDSFYQSEAWNLCKSECLEVNGSSIESVLLQARLVEEELQKRAAEKEKK